jgi:hypothetical protein
MHCLLMHRPLMNRAAVRVPAQPPGNRRRQRRQAWMEVVSSARPPSS